MDESTLDKPTRHLPAAEPVGLRGKLPVAVDVGCPRVKNIFLSYGRDQYAVEATRIKQDLECNGYKVWCDTDQIKPGHAWSEDIDAALSASDIVVVLVTPHAMRRFDPIRPELGAGFCLNEINRARDLHKRIIPVYLVTIPSGVPVILSGIHYIEMRDCVPFAEFPQKYHAQFQCLLDEIAGEGIDRDGSRAAALTAFKPLDFGDKFDKHLAGFTGRQWLNKDLNRWLAESPSSRAFCLVGDAGIGKSAIAANWCRHREDVVAYHFCEFGRAETTDPVEMVRSIAGQLIQKPGFELYASRLQHVQLDARANQNADQFFHAVLLDPLSKQFPAPAGDRLVIVDALDEANRGTLNELAEFLGRNWKGLPRWLRLVTTSRNDPVVLRCLNSLDPHLKSVMDPRESRNTQDIREYVTRELAHVAGGVDARFVDAIVANSQGLFQYVKFVVDEVRAGTLSKDNVDQLPKQMAGYYQRWFRRAFASGEPFQPEYERIIGVIVAAAAALPFDVLAGALGLQVRDLSKQFEKLATLFPLRGASGERRAVPCVTMIHKSLRDWLTGYEDNHLMAGEFSVSEEAGNTLLAEYCWRTYKSGDLRQSEYCSRTILRHLAADRQHQRLAEVMLDPALLETLWGSAHRCEWQRYIGSLRSKLSLPALVSGWLDANLPAGGGSEHAAVLAGKLGGMLQEVGALDQALLLANASIDHLKSAGVVDSADLVPGLLTIAAVHSAREEHQQSIVFYEQALQISEALDPEGPETADVLYQLNVAYCGRGEYEKAWDCLKRCRKLREQLTPSDPAGVASCINDEAVILTRQGRAGDYLGLYKSALKIFEASFPDGHPEMVATLLNVATELQNEDKKPEAMEFLRRAVSMSRDILLPQHGYSTSAHHSLASLHMASSDFQSAIKLMEDQLRACEACLGPEHEDVAEARAMLCVTLARAIHLSDESKDRRYRTELRTQCRRIGRAASGTVLHLLGLADSLREAAEPALASCVFDAARRACAEDSRFKHNQPAEDAAAQCFAELLDAAVSSHPFAEICSQMRDIWQRAIPVVREYGDCLTKVRSSVAILVCWIGKKRLEQENRPEPIHMAFDLVSEIAADSPKTLGHLAGLTSALHGRRFDAECERLCETLFDRSRSALGERHVQTLQYLANLAFLRMYRGRPGEAKLLFRRVVDGWIAIHGVEQTNTLSAFASLIECLLLEGDFEGADREFAAFKDRLPDVRMFHAARIMLARAFNGAALRLKNELSAFDATRRCYEYSSQLDPANATTHGNFALFLWVCAGDEAAARREFEESIRLDPNDGNVHSNMAHMLAQSQRDYPAAKSHFEKAVRLSPNETNVLGNFAACCIVQGEIEEAWRLAKRSMKMAIPDPDRLMCRPLFCAAAILLLSGRDAGVPLGQMRTLLDRGIDHVLWVTAALLEYLDARLPPQQAQLMRSISRAIDDKAEVAALANVPLFPSDGVPFDRPWPEPFSP